MHGLVGERRRRRMPAALIAPSRTVVLDGGLATELEARGARPQRDRLWSGAAARRPTRTAIEAVHLDYFRAGARGGDDRQLLRRPCRVAQLLASIERPALAAIRRSVELARRARDRYAAESGVPASELLVAGSVGPYGAMLADGSEYRGDYDPGTVVLRDVHAPRMEAPARGWRRSGGAWRPSRTSREAEVLVELLASFGARGWLSCQRSRRDDDGGRRAGRCGVRRGGRCARVDRGRGQLRRARDTCRRSRCRPPEATGLPTVAYPNGGDAWIRSIAAGCPATAMRSTRVVAARLTSAPGGWVAAAVPGRVTSRPCACPGGARRRKPPRQAELGPDLSRDPVPAGLDPLRTVSDGRREKMRIPASDQRLDQRPADERDERGHIEHGPLIARSPCRGRTCP